MFQNIIVYLLIALALAGAGRFLYRKLRVLRKNSSRSSCETCSLKKNCETKNRGNLSGGCCSG